MVSMPLNLNPCVLFVEFLPMAPISPMAAHKYCLLQAFCIPTDEQKDPDYQTHDVQPKSKKDQTARKNLIKEFGAMYEKLPKENKTQKMDEWLSTIDDRTDQEISVAMNGLRSSVK